MCDRAIIPGDCTLVNTRVSHVAFTPRAKPFEASQVCRSERLKVRFRPSFVQLFHKATRLSASFLLKRVSDGALLKVQIIEIFFRIARHHGKD